MKFALLPLLKIILIKLENLHSNQFWAIPLAKDKICIFVNSAHELSYGEKVFEIGSVILE